MCVCLSVSLLTPWAAAHPPPPGYQGFSGRLLRANLVHRPVTPLHSFWAVYGVIFPAMTG